MKEETFNYNEHKAKVKAFVDAAIDEDILSREHSNPLFLKRTVGICLTVASVLAVVLLVLARPASDGGQSRQEEISENWTELYAGPGECKDVVLSDGSRIWIHNDSRVMFPDKFTGDVRRVFTSGEIYAEISADSSHPFIVVSNGVNVRVKGTRFNFRSYKDRQEAELTLLSGAVDMNMMVSGRQKSLSVTPGNTVKADLGSGAIMQFPTDTSTYVSWKDARVLYFNDEALEFIAVDLRREFGVNVEIVGEALSKMRFYASFYDVDSITDVLEALNTSGMMDITFKNNTYYLSAK